MELRCIDADNWKECIGLWTTEDTYVASNLYSIAEAQFHPKAVSKAIYEDGTMVGYAMFGEDDDDSSIFVLDRLMIGKRYRRKGIASRAIQAIIGIARELGGVEKVVTSTELENGEMRKVLLRNGFMTDNEMDGDEVIYYYRLK